MCMSFGARAQIPTYRLAGTDSLYRFDFSRPEIAQPKLLSAHHDPPPSSGGLVGEIRTVDIYSGPKLLFYERNDSFFNAADIAIFTLHAKTDWVVGSPRKHFLGRTMRESNAFDGIYDFEHYVVRNEHSKSTDIILRLANSATVHKYTLPDDANKWLTDTELKHDSIDGLWMRDITATRTSDGLGAWLLGSNNEYIFVLRLQNDKLTLVHQYDSLPGGWGGMELYSSIAINNAGTQLAVGSYDITNPKGRIGKNTRLTTYSFDRQTGVLSFNKIIRDIALNIPVGFSGEDAGVEDYSPGNPHKYFEQEQFEILPYNRSNAYGSIFLNLCFTADDSIVYASHTGAPFGVDIPNSSWDRNTNTFSHSNVMAVNVNTGKYLLVELDQFVGYQNLLQANGQIWIHVNHGASPDWYIVKHPEDVFERGIIEVEEYSWPIRQKNYFNIITFNRGLHNYRKLDLAEIDSCMSIPRLLIAADTSYFDSFRLEQGTVSITFSKEQLVEANFEIACPNFKYGQFPITLFGMRDGIVAQSKTKQIIISKNYRQPIASFEIKDTVGCQWINYELTNKSFVISKGADVYHHWDFGNGTDTTIVSVSGSASNLASTNVVFDISGRYPISLTVDDGYCRDTFTIADSITILEAPRPGMLLSDTAGCEPFDLIVENEYKSLTDSITYYWGDGTSHVVRCLPECASQFKTYTVDSRSQSDKNFRIIQELHGPTGCVTKDTASIKIFSSFLPTDRPYISLVSISQDQQVEIRWDSLEHTSYYDIFKDGKFLDSVEGISVILEDLNFSKTMSNYTIKGVNVCDESSLLSNVSQNILLKGVGSEDNRKSYLNWNEYVGWRNGVNFYELEELSGGIFFQQVSGILSNNIFSFNDESFLSKLSNSLNKEELRYEKCYRVRASESISGIKSYSNTICVPYRPVLIAPNAFSPNNDGHNDTYNLVAFGYTAINLEIYNRWGQKIHEGSFWDGKILELDAPSSVYTILFSGETIDGNREFKTFTISLVR
jgi:gliding motility-associated-like protein